MSHQFNTQAEHDAYVDERKKSSTLWSIIMASSLGTLIEWYDFYIFGSLAVVLSTKFFPADNPTAAFLSTLATFAAGFVVRPFGALFFGRLGDIIGRKYTFLVTLLIMGFSTFLIGCIPSYETIGFMAPVLVQHFAKNLKPQSFQNQGIALFFLYFSQVRGLSRTLK